MDEKVQKVLDYIEEHKEEYLELLLRFCRQPSVAATGEGIEKMAGMVVDELKKLGVDKLRQKLDIRHLYFVHSGVKMYRKHPACGRLATVSVHDSLAHQLRVC